MGKIDLPLKTKDITENVEEGTISPKSLTTDIGDRAFKRVTDDVLPDSDTDIDIDTVILKRYFDLSLDEMDQDRYIKALVEWGKHKGMDRTGLKSKIRQIESHLGHRDEDRPKRIYQYLKLSDQLEEISGKLAALEL